MILGIYQSKFIYVTQASQESKKIVLVLHPNKKHKTKGGGGGGRGSYIKMALNESSIKQLQHALLL